MGSVVDTSGSAARVWRGRAGLEPWPCGWFRVVGVGVRGVAVGAVDRGGGCGGPPGAGASRLRRQRAVGVLFTKPGRARGWRCSAPAHDVLRPGVIRARTSRGRLPWWLRRVRRGGGAGPRHLTSTSRLRPGCGALRVHRSGRGVQPDRSRARHGIFWACVGCGRRGGPWIGVDPAIRGGRHGVAQCPICRVAYLPGRVGSLGCPFRRVSCGGLCPLCRHVAWMIRARRCGARAQHEHGISRRRIRVLGYWTPRLNNAADHLAPPRGVM